MTGKLEGKVAWRRIEVAGGGGLWMVGYRNGMYRGEKIWVS